MAARAVVIRLGCRVAASQGPATARRAFLISSEKQYHSGSRWQQNVSSRAKPTRSQDPNPIAASMANSTTPTGEDSNDAKHAAFLGEADSDDGFEADIEINPEAHRHKFDDVNASGLHGTSTDGYSRSSSCKQPSRPSICPASFSVLRTRSPSFGSCARG